MKITTIDKQLVDTDTLPDLKAQLIELIENSGLLKFAGQYGGACFVWGKTPNKDKWVTQLIKDDEDLEDLLAAVNQLIIYATKGKAKLIVVDKNFVPPK